MLLKFTQKWDINIVQNDFTLELLTLTLGSNISHNQISNSIKNVTSSLEDLSCLGGVAGDAWLNKSGNTELVRVPGVPKPLGSPLRFFKYTKN